jgi:LPS-assembly lipoprotein
MQRRAWLVALAGASALAGCGFQLRRAPELPFKTLHLAGFKPTSPMGVALRRALAGAPTTRLVEGRAQAEAIFEVLGDADEKNVVAYTSSAQVRELQLRSRLVFQLQSASGRELIGRTEIVQSRDMSYKERDALAKEQEEQLLYRAMQDDIALQVVRRLAAIKP